MREECQERKIATLRTRDGDRRFPSGGGGNLSAGTGINGTALSRSLLQCIESVDFFGSVEEF